MAVIPSSERKGLAYEAVVACALNLFLQPKVCPQPALKGVLADQDIAWPLGENPRLVVSVTHWGSHEAAKMKFWRIHEDLFETFAAFPNSLFMSVVFERNPGSDENLCALLSNFTSGISVSDLDSDSIPKIQQYVSTPDILDLFFASDDIVKCCDDTLKQNSGFRTAVRKLSKAMQAKLKGAKRDKRVRCLLEKCTAGGSPEFRDPGRLATWYKPSLIHLLEVGKDLKDVFDLVEEERPLDDLPQAVHRRLRDCGAMVESTDSLDVEYVPSELLNLLIQQGRAWCDTQAELITESVHAPEHSMFSYHDHVIDVLNPKDVQRRVEILRDIESATKLRELIISPGHGMNRKWPIDYLVILTRSVTKGGKYGFSKLSAEIGVNYIGGISPLPQYVTGNTNALSRSEITCLAKRLYELKVSLPEDVSEVQVIKDRKTTLRKKLSVIDLVLESEIRKLLPNAIVTPGVSVQHPLASQIRNRNAGVTKYNLSVELSGHRLLIFVVFSDDATHKHKEVSGRLRGTRGTDFLHANDHCLLLVDGNLLADGNRDRRIQMLREAGWEGAYFLHEVDEIASIVDEAD